MKRLIVCAVLAALCLAGCTGCTDTDTAPESSLPETTAAETTEAVTETEPETAPTETTAPTEATTEATEATETTEATEATEAETAAPADPEDDEPNYGGNELVDDNEDTPAPEQPAQQSRQEAPAPTANVTDDGVIEFPIIPLN